MPRVRLTCTQVNVLWHGSCRRPSPAHSFRSNIRKKRQNSLLPADFFSVGRWCGLVQCEIEVCRRVSSWPVLWRPLQTVTSNIGQHHTWLPFHLFDLHSSLTKLYHFLFYFNSFEYENPLLFDLCAFCLSHVTLKCFKSSESHRGDLAAPAKSQRARDALERSRDHYTSNLLNSSHGQGWSRGAISTNRFISA